MISDVYTGDDVLEWFGTDDAARQARRIVRRRGLSAADVLADDVLQEAWIAVRVQMRLIDAARGRQSRRLRHHGHQVGRAEAGPGPGRPAHR